MNISTIAMIAAATVGAALLTTGASGQTPVPGGTHVICTPQPVVCTSFNLRPDDRFDPFVQHLLVRQQIQALPLGAQITSFYMPYPSDTRSIEEIQIRYMDELRRREAAEAAAAEAADAAEPTDEG